MTISKLLFAKFPQVFSENILWQFQNLSLPKFLIFSSRTFQDNFKTCLCQYSSSPLRKNSKTISKLVMSKFPHLLFENILRLFQNLSLPNFLITSSKKFLGHFKNLSLPNFLISSSKMFQDNFKNVVAKFPHLLSENFLWQFQNLSLPNFLIFSSRTFQDNFKTCLCQYFSSPLRKHSKTISKLVLADFPPLLFENIRRQFLNLSLSNFLISSSKLF